MFRVGLCSLSDGRRRVHMALKADILAHQNKIQRILEQAGVQVFPAHEVVYSAETAKREALALSVLHLDAVIFNIPVFSFPNFLMIATKLLRGPYLLLGPQDPRYPGLGGLLAAGGALSQVGVYHERIWADLDDPTLPNQLLQFVRAAAAVSRLPGQVYGLIGGRSIGMQTGTAPTELWSQKFGLDVEHIDQSEIVRRAQLAPKETIRAARAWIESQVGLVQFDGDQLTSEKFDFQIGCWIAVQEMIEEFSLDFVGLKCHYEMSEYFSTQCLGAAFINDPYDWRGPKNPVPLACEADSDGALTMQIMSLITRKPTCLLDLRFYDREQNLLVMPNCGAAPTWYAARSTDPAENLSRVRIVPSITKYAGGGAHVEFEFGPGTLTLARLTRSPSGYRMLITQGETLQPKNPEVKGRVANWPHAFVRSQASVQDFVKNMEANHIHAVDGDCRAELENFCKMLSIAPVVL